MIGDLAMYSFKPAFTTPNRNNKRVRYIEVSLAYIVSVVLVKGRFKIVIQCIDLIGKLTQRLFPFRHVTLSTYQL